MEQCEVLVIVREKDATRTHGAHEMHWVGIAGRSRLMGCQDVMACICQTAHQGSVDRVVVEI
jgi:hypothetical protein